MTGFLLDTDIVSIFAKAEALALLCRLFRCERLPIAAGVFDELLVPLDYGYDFPQRILELADVVVLTPEEFGIYEALRLQGQVSTADAELIAICQQRGWAYVAMDRVALRCADDRGIRTIDLQALLKAMLEASILTRGELKTLVERMEREDRTVLPYKESLLAST